METEAGRLERLYHEMNDEHLLDMAKDPDSLTGEARAALNRELHGRGLSQPPPSTARTIDMYANSETVEPEVEPQLEQGFAAGIPGLFPSSAAIMEQALEPAGKIVEGRARLISFYDGHELTRACETLETAGITPEIESVAGDAMSGAPPRFDIWIEAGRLERAESLLRETLGLFPLAEEQTSHAESDTAPAGDEPGDQDGMITVAEFESAKEAAQAIRLLGDQGITARLDEQRTADEGTYAVQVKSGDQERALSAVAAALGVE